MDLYVISSMFLILGLLFIRLKKINLQPMTMLSYGLSIGIVAFLETSDHQFVFILRYFIYLISGFVIAMMPIIFVLIFIFILLKGMKSSEFQKYGLFLDGLIAVFLLVLTLFIIWAMFHFEQEAWERLIASLVNMTIYFMAIFFVFIILNVCLHYWPLSYPINAIVILGAQVENPEQLPQILKSRVQYALKIFQTLSDQEQQAIHFIVSGSRSNENLISEAKAIHDLLLQHGIPSNKIILEEEARSTHENLKFISDILLNKKQKNNILVITSDFHLVRTHILGWHHQLYFQLKGAPTPIWLLPYYLVRDFISFVVLTKGTHVLLLIYLLLRSFLKF
ncbi:YdcF family protein [Aerococcaceae bacterium DSM 111020]|nr:YdcF family protein [Aerococcaceae bacterium DSM 111020]